jgi:phenylacetate-CoA ligase
MDHLETLSSQECFERIEETLLASQLKYVVENSPFYAEKFKGAGLDSRQILDINRFSLIPYTFKEELLAEQEKYPPFGRLATGGDVMRLRRVHLTSGSTGKPYYVIMTENDIASTVEAGRRAFLCAGLTANDLVIHCLNYCLWAGGLTDHLNLESTGATVIPFGVGNSKNLIRTILYLKPTAISCTPSYLSRLECLLRGEFGLEPPSLGLNKGFLGGEGGLQNPGVRARIEDTWKMKAIDANYGMADVLSIFGSECEARQGLHFHGQGILNLELVDPGTGKNLPVQEGQVGEMVLTNLKREAQPLLRYRSRDVIKIASTQECSCGRRSFRFLVVGRTDDMIVVRGVNIYPSAVATLLAEPPQWFSGEFELVLEGPPPYDNILLRVELARQFGLDEVDNVRTELLQRCKDLLNFTPRLELIDFGRFPRTEGKTKRIKRIEVGQDYK